MRNQFQNQKQLMKCMHDKFERALIFSSLGFYQMFFFLFLLCILMQRMEYAEGFTFI